MVRSQGGSGVVTQANSHPSPELRAVLSEIANVTDALVDALDAAGLNEQLRQSAKYSLHVLDRSLPKQNVDEFLLAYEAFATMTGPAALAAGDLTRLHDEAQRLLALVQALGRGVSRRQGLTRSTSAMQNLHLRAALSEPPVRAGFSRLQDLLGVLVRVETGTGQARPRLVPFVPLGRRALAPGMVIVGALALIVFLTATIVFATGQVPLSPKGAVLPVLSNASPPTGRTATATSQTNSHGVDSQATATSPGGPTPTSLPSKPALTVSPSAVQPCQGSDVQFTITAGGGQGSVSWTATSPDTVNVALSMNGQSFSGQVSGTLQPGQSVTVIVRVLNDTNTASGTINISASSDHPSGVSYDTSSC